MELEPLIGEEKETNKQHIPGAPGVTRVPVITVEPIFVLHALLRLSGYKPI